MDKELDLYGDEDSSFEERSSCMEEEEKQQPPRPKILTSLDPGYWEECDNVTEPAIFDVSLRPPAHPPADYGASPISWILLDLRAYIADRSDDASAAATTAKSTTRGGHPIEVTLCAARPPLVSHLCVHCPSLKPTRFAIEPTIVAMDDDVILLGVVIGHRALCMEQEAFDLFIYQPAARSLKLLPRPADSSSYLACADVGLLRCNRAAPGDYIVASLSAAGNPKPGEYVLHRFRSTTDAWSSTKLCLGPMDPTPGLSFFRHHTDKVIALGGNLIAFVDLWRGILLCDVDLDEPKPQYIHMPHQLKPKSELCTIEAPTLRDIAFVQGRIKCVHREYVPGGGWTAAIWSKETIDPLKEDWRMDCELSASDIEGPLPAGMDKPALQRLLVGHPTLSLQQDGVVCFMAKRSLQDDEAWVLAVDIRNQQVRRAAEFNGERKWGLCLAYRQVRHTPGAKGHLKRPWDAVDVMQAQARARGLLKDDLPGCADPEDSMDL